MRRPPPRFWWLARGIHRSLVGFMLLAVMLGGAGGAALYAAITRESGPGSLLCIALSLLGAVWPLAWIATLRIARPLRHLASVAGQIQRGHLASRDKLPEGPVEVGEVAGALRALANRLSQQLQHQRALMAAVSHELRSPLGRARVLVELSREGLGPPTVHDDLQAEIDAMDHLVGDLLATARIDFEAINLHDLDPLDIGRRALGLAGLPADALITEGDTGVIQADPTLLTRALTGLLDNARRYGGQMIRLHIRGRVHRVRFEVVDDGPGFAPGDEVRAFEPFYRGPTAEGRPRGEGLGLALVRQIAEAHQGEAGAHNRSAGGACVWIELPRQGEE